jgi:hypothetical protein
MSKWKKWQSRMIGAALLLSPLIFIFGIVKTRAYDWERWFLYFSERGRVVPFSFYGVVTDQQGTPIDGAEVRIRVSTINNGYLLGGESTSRDYELTLSTGPKGAFAIDGVQGSSIAIIAIDKPGYAHAPDQTWFDCERCRDCLGFYFSSTEGRGQYFPDRNNPAVYPLLRPKEPWTLRPSRGGKP